MIRFIRAKSFFSAVVVIAALVSPTIASAEILAYKQLQSMFERGNGWHLVFVERLANTGSSTEVNVQISTDLIPLGSGHLVNIISKEVFIQQEGGGLGVGVAQINPSFNGVGNNNLLLPGATLGTREVLRVSYSVDVELTAGPIVVQSVASPGGDVSANGEKSLDINDDLDTPTLISLPRTVGTPTECPSNQIESTFNLIKNGDFSVVHGKKPSGDQPLKIESDSIQLLANSFFSDSPYAGDDAFAADNNQIGVFDVEFFNGISIQQSNVGNGITLFSGGSFQHGFPGDFNRGVASSDNYLLYNGNSSNLSVDVWKQQISGLKKDVQYHFVAYTSNVAWPGITNQIEPSIQLLATNAEGGNLTPVIIPQEASNEQDTWRPVSTIITPIGVDPVELSINDGNVNHVFGDQLALAQIGLFQCLDAAGDDDGDGLSNQAEVTLNTNPDNADSDGDGASDLVEVGSISSPLDRDGDGIIDALESSLPSADADGDGIVDEEDPTNDGPSGDADNDGISNGDELRVGSNPNNPDTDGDGKLDGVEFGKDSDNDGKPDIIESNIDDEDNDGFSDEIDNFDNRQNTPTGSGGGSVGFLFLLLPAFIRYRRLALNKNR